MSIATTRNWVGLELSKWVSDRQSLILFSATLLLSATLLFSVQPLFAKMVLPYLGGSPSVWAVAMCFFQAALLAGYCYAHALNRFVSSTWAPFIHIALCFAAFMALPFGLPDWAHEVPEGNTYLWLVGVLTIGVGLPFFAVSANAPLLQAWFARSGHPHGNDPYFLYGASNLGSLTSLLAYPFVIEPMLGLDTQTSVWTWGFCLLTALLVACGGLMIVGRIEAKDDTDVQPASASKFEPVTAKARLAWIGLAFVPSALLVAFTSHITTDIASAPFLWVIPLAAFLGTFVIVFRDRSMIPHHFVLKAQPYLVAAALVFVVIPGVGNVALKVLAGFIAFIATTLICHRALYEERPAANRLTEFYLYMSLGGVLGGVFAALIAPQLFSTVAEYPLLMVAGLLARPSVFKEIFAQDNTKSIMKMAGLVAAGVLCLVCADALGVISSSQALVFSGFIVLGVIGALALASDRPARMAKFGVSAVVALALTSSINLEDYRERSFFGVSRVITTEDGKYRLLTHGTTLHGGERLVDEDGNRPASPPPVLYYYPGSPMARGFDVARSAMHGAAHPIQVGVIGLGTGSLACHIKGSETIRFYEIDPVVARIARNRKYFRYISTCAPSGEIVVGDARLTLAKAKTGQYDYLVVDAFSSDAVPVHLITREAIELYLSKVKDSGLIAMHISNRHLELESVIAATAGQIEGVHLAAIFAPNGQNGYDGKASHVVFLSKNKPTIDKVLAWKGARPANARTTRGWSDNYADIMSALWRRYSE